MTLPIRSDADFFLNQLLNAIAEKVTADPGTATAGRIIYRTDTSTFKVGNGTAFVSFLPSTIRLDQILAPQAAVSLNGQRATGAADPVNAQDLVTLGFVQALVQGQDWKASVRAASTGNVTVAAPGAAVDGVTLATNDRVLLKNQTAPAENGVYVFNGAASALTRAADGGQDKLTSGATVPVAEGTANADTVWLLTTNDPITVGTTGQVWSQLPTTAVQAGAGLQLIGSILSLVTPVSIANGGTGAGSASGARAALGAIGKFVGQITGDGSATSFPVTHGLNTKAVLCDVWKASNDQWTLVERVRTSVNVVSVVFAQAPASGEVFDVVVSG